MNQKAAAALTVLLGFAPASVSAQEEPPAESRLRIAFIAKSYANPVFRAAHRGAQDAARKLSSEGIPVEVLVLTPTGEDPEQQAQRIGMAVEQGAQGIAVAASDTAAVTKADVSGSIPMELVRVSGENLGEWARQLRDWGFPAVPEEYLKRE